MRIGTRDDATTMFDSLAVNTTIRYLDLSNNEIDDECISAISLALCDNVTITHINLRNNKITSEGAECKNSSQIKFRFFVLHLRTDLSRFLVSRLNRNT